MDEKEKYEKLINNIRKIQPILDQKEKLVDDVMDKLRHTGSKVITRGFFDFIFAWADKMWIRRSMAMASFLLITVFLFQQFMIINRIGDLEIRMVNGTSDDFNRYLIQKGSTGSVLRMISEEEMAGDSLFIAERDLIDLIRSYKDLQEKYEELENLVIDRKYLQGMPEDKKLNGIQKTNKKIKT